MPETLRVTVPNGVRLRVTVADQVESPDGLDRVPEGERVRDGDVVEVVERVCDADAVRDMEFVLVPVALLVAILGWAVREGVLVGG